MLPAHTIAEITTNLAALNLQPNTTAQILAAVFAPLLRSSDPDPAGPKRRQKRAGRPRSRGTPRRKYKRRAPRSVDVRERARAALKDHPDKTVNAIAKMVKCHRATVSAARTRPRRRGPPQATL